MKLKIGSGKNEWRGESEESELIGYIDPVLEQVRDQHVVCCDDGTLLDFSRHLVVLTDAGSNALGTARTWIGLARLITKASYRTATTMDVYR